MLAGSGFGAIALIAFLAFTVSGLIWLVVTLQQADPAVTRRNTSMVALVSGAVLTAVLLAQALFLPPRGAAIKGATRLGPSFPGLQRPPLGGGGAGQGFGGRFAQPPDQPVPVPAAPQIQPRRPNAPAQPAPSGRTFSAP